MITKVRKGLLFSGDYKSILLKNITGYSRSLYFPYPRRFIYDSKALPPELSSRKKLNKPNIFSLSKTYDPSLVEKDWYQFWDRNELFKPRFDKEGKVKKEGLFCIPVPPPNITGALHIGHALTVSLEDSMARFYRMKGKTVLFLPGFDHAGIATQSVVEKNIWKTEHKTRLDYTRPEFVSKIWKWKDVYHDRIKNQFKKLGGSYDWSREAFTLDETRSRAVDEAFIRLFDKGIIYRDLKLVNWSTKLKTSISNLEVDNLNIDGPTMINVPNYDAPVNFGVLYYIAYEVADCIPGTKLIVATSRPETIFGDVAIAIHPDDERYTHLHGKFVKHPFIDKKIPIILDSQNVDKAFGTGMVKITPAHDENDYSIAKRNNLPFINILTEDGLLNENTGPNWKGLKRFDARNIVIEKLKEKGLFIKAEGYKTTIRLCSRSNDVIEPLLKSQWWVSQGQMAKNAIRKVQKKEILIQPSSTEADYFRWLTNIKDWCISRQLWWGHRCPVYFVAIEGEDNDSNSSMYWIAAHTLEEAQRKAVLRFPNKKFTLNQDEDVLDTWFSSALWPLSTLGWPTKGKDLENFYPFSLLESGWDILFFWITRMILLNMKLTGIVPFKEVFCHPLVRDNQGRKMSKSLGNVIDPIDVIEGISLEDLQTKLQSGNFSQQEINLMTKLQRKSFPKGIPQLGTDALRFTLCSYTSSSNCNDINLDIKKIEENKRFINKIYQAVRFLHIHAKGLTFYDLNHDLSTMDLWIRCQLEMTSNRIKKHFESRNFMGVTTELYQFWYLLCDNYIEYVKYILSQSDMETKTKVLHNLQYLLDNALRLLHPMMPYITEELWQLLPSRKTTDISISISAYPYFESRSDNLIEKMVGNKFWDVVQHIRSLCEQYNVRSKGSINIFSNDPEFTKYISNNVALLKYLTSGKINSVMITEQGNNDVNTNHGWVNKYVCQDISVSVCLKDHIDDATVTVSKCRKKIKKLSQKLTSLEKIMESASYERNVASEIKETNKRVLNDLKAEINTYYETMGNLERLL